MAKIAINLLGMATVFRFFSRVTELEHDTDLIRLGNNCSQRSQYFSRVWVTQTN